MNRRNFIGTSCLACVALAIGLGVESCQKNSSVNPKSVNFTIDLSSASNSALKTIGGYVYTNGVYVFRSGNKSYQAFSDACTHNGCAVSFNSSSKQFVCPCHSGVFDKNGNVVSGPPNSPLNQYNTSVSGNILTIAS